MPYVPCLENKYVHTTTTVQEKVHKSAQIESGYKMSSVVGHATGHPKHILNMLKTD